MANHRTPLFSVSLLALVLGAVLPAQGAWSRHSAKQIESRNETERARFNRMQLEAARRLNGYVDEPA